MGRKEKLGVPGRHIAKRCGPFLWIPLSFLRVTCVWKGPNEEVTCTDRFVLRNPRPSVIVGFAFCVIELNIEPSHVHGEIVGVGNVGRGGGKR